MKEHGSRPVEWESRERGTDEVSEQLEGRMVSQRWNVRMGRWGKRVLPHVGELSLVVGAYFAYMYTRKLAFSDLETIALDNATRIISLERSLGFFWEPEWQAWTIASAKSLVVFLNWAYIVTFWPIILTTAVILYVGNRRRYAYYRNVVLLSFVFALLGFMLFPLAPPRMLADHFVDTIKTFGPAFYASREFANYYNPYAAMPSLHFSWTIMFGVLFLRSRRIWLKVFGVLYPAVTLVAITVTANHYIMDAIGGALLIGASFAFLELVIRRRLFLAVPVKRLWHRLHWGRITRKQTDLQEQIQADGAPAERGITGQALADRQAGSPRRR